MGKYLKDGKDHNSQWKMEICFTENLEIELSKKKIDFQ